MKKVQFVVDFRQLATQLNGYVIAGNWARLAEALETARITLTAEEAARWAGLGYLPEEAGPLILDGITAAATGEMERHAEHSAGGRDALAAQRIGEWLSSGALLTEGDVVRVQDPTDPGQELIAPRDEL